MRKYINSGFSLIETVVVLAASSIVLLGISQLLASNQRLLKKTESYIEQTSEHLSAFNQLKSQNQIAEIIGISARVNAKPWFQSYINQRALNIDNFKICLQGNTTGLSIDCSTFNFAQPNPNDPTYPQYPVTIHRIPSDPAQAASYESKIVLNFDCTTTQCSTFYGSLETSNMNSSITKSTTKFSFPGKHAQAEKFSFPGKHAQAEKNFLFSKVSGSNGVSISDCGAINSINLEDKTYTCAHKDFNLESGKITTDGWTDEPYNLTDSNLFINNSIRASNYPYMVKAHGFTSINLIGKNPTTEYHAGVCVSESLQWNSYRSSDYDRYQYACCRSPLNFAPNDNPTIYNASPMPSLSNCTY